MTTMRRALSLFGWTKHSSILLGGFLLTIFLILYIWWPLAEEVLAYIDWNGPWWLYIDWLLIGIFLFMSLTIIARADLRSDGLIVFVGVFGGLAIESWGTQTNLWHYYTAERPPLWIIPAWPIASLSIDRITYVLNALTTKVTKSTKDLRKNPFMSFVLNFKTSYWIIFAFFYFLMLYFVAPTLDKSYTWLSLLLCALLILTPNDHRTALLTFLAGAGLGYFLELWGTTRECWTYYTFQTPPLFAVVAHGMAALAFWRTGQLVNQTLARLGRWGQRMAGDSGPLL